MCLARKFTYSGVGVDRRLRAESKKALGVLKGTYRFSPYGKVVRLPFGNIFPFHDSYLDLVIEEIGTKVFVAQVAGKYDTIAIDGIAMAVNDVIRSGARPLAIADNIHEQVSDPALIKEWMKGIVKGAVEAACVVPSGEIGDVSELIKGIVEGKGFDMVFASIGEVTRCKVISGRNINPGDVVIGMRSSGVHSNGISLVRRVLFKQWGGKYEADAVPSSLDKSVAEAVLEPTRIYVKPLLKVAGEFEVKGAVHITGDGYLKFGNLAKFSKGIGFVFDNFEPQPIFDLIQRTAAELGGGISDEEMFKTFNMGWGFAVIVDKSCAEKAVDVLEKAGVQSERIGRVTGQAGVKIVHRGKKIVLK
jgi:phosphoribosylformylglycinamidine cyclo-ligase